MQYLRWPLSLIPALALCLSLFFPHAAPRAAAEEHHRFTNSLGMEFVLLESGSFMMGSPKDAPYRHESETRHQETISRAFFMQTTEVTVGQWWAVMGKKWFFPREGPENMPVTQVSWHDCQSFISRLNQKTDDGTYRLPTEAEWEYACRAGTSTAYSFGEELTCSQAMFSNNTLKADQCVPYVKSHGLETNCPAPVKRYPPNPWGLYDMHGNVWEWCQDCYGNYTSLVSRGTFECSRRIRRGGSWYKFDYACRSANRAYAHPSAKFKTTGFRLVKEVH